ncbi:ABC transporter substrate-binding protein [Paenibacillus sp. NPDC058071]|uniref:ABC transporter substrate-binding protein n=1 Tax=Paenibacillus sp. NPDC058071 TaxID=3346326 RepID=UPI0036D8D6CE
MNIKINAPSKAILYVSIIILLLAGCSGKEPADKANAGSGTPPEELTVLLDWYPNAVHTFLYAAEEQGYFAEEGLKVKLQTPADTNDALKLVAAGKADLALSYQMQVAVSRSEDIPVVSVAAIVRHPLNQLFATESSGIERPSDLIGRKIGYPSIPLYEAYVRTMAEADGSDQEKLRFTDVGWDLIPAMSTGQVDAIIGGYINHEKLLLEKEGVKLRTFNPVDYGVPDYYELVLTASESGAEQKAGAIAKFIRAAAKGQAYTENNPDEALQVLLNKQNEMFPLDPEIEKASLGVLLPLMNAGSEPFGSQSLDSWNSVIEWLDRQGLLSKPIKAEEAFRSF